MVLRRGRVRRLPWCSASSPRFLGTLLLAGAMLAVGELAAPQDALSKGGVRAPSVLRAADCVAGSRPRLAPAGVEVLVLGCAEMRDGARVLVAAEGEVGGPDLPAKFVWFYVVPEGQEDASPSGTQVDPPDAASASSLPLTGGRGIAPSALVLRVGRRGPAYVSGQASARVTSVSVGYRTRSGETREDPAALIRVGPRIARRLHAFGPFAYFVGEVPPEADRCRGIGLVGRDRLGLAVDNEWPVPSSGWGQLARGCRARPPLRGSLVEILRLALSELRLPVLLSG